MKVTLKRNIFLALKKRKEKRGRKREKETEMGREDQLTVREMGWEKRDKINFNSKWVEGE